MSAVQQDAAGLGWRDASGDDECEVLIHDGGRVAAGVLRDLRGADADDVFAGSRSVDVEAFDVVDDIVATLLLHSRHDGLFPPVSQSIPVVLVQPQQRQN